MEKDLYKALRDMLEAGKVMEWGTHPKNSITRNAYESAKELANKYDKEGKTPVLKTKEAIKKARKNG